MVLFFFFFFFWGGGGPNCPNFFDGVLTHSPILLFFPMSLGTGFGRVRKSGVIFIKLFFFSILNCFSTHSFFQRDLGPALAELENMV